MTETPVVLAVHGGAGALRARNYDREIAHMRDLVAAGRERLLSGGAALDVVAEAVAAMEASGLYVAGRGASPNAAGLYELDAALMDGADGRVGAVAALEGFASPIAIARAVMERTPHVLLAGEGARAFAAEAKMEKVADPDAWFTRVGWGGRPAAELATGTVGAVARDREGRLAAATSTAGVLGKLWGRVGDSPIPGAGVWADRVVAVSCTGTGEMFVRAAAAAQIAFRMRFGGQSLDEAAAAVLAEVRALGGNGGLIAIGADGSLVMPFSTEGMKRAALRSDGSITSEVF